MKAHTEDKPTTSQVVKSRNSGSAAQISCNDGMHFNRIANDQDYSQPENHSSSAENDDVGVEMGMDHGTRVHPLSQASVEDSGEIKAPSIADDADNYDPPRYLTEMWRHSDRPPVHG